MSATCRWTWPIVVPAGGDGLRAGRGGELAEDVLEVERQRRHLEPAVVVVAPLLTRPVAIDLDPVAVGVRQIQSLRDEVVRRTV